MTSRIDDYVITIEQAENSPWDVLVLGAGVGGCTSAYGLAKRGLKVLLLEKGKASFSRVSEKGIEAAPEDPLDRFELGYWPEKITATIDGNTADIWAPLGCGVGGSSLLYSAALSRLEPMDFLPQTQSDNRSPEWPFTYQELEPYYEQAERLYSVCGSANPLARQSPWPINDPVPINELDRHFFDSFEKAGLNPYRLHVGLKNVDGCSGCAGRHCPRQCKQSAVQSCILPILEQGFISILECTEAMSFEASATEVTGLKVDCDGRRVTLKASAYVLAAGAYFSPAILQNSRSDQWPNGLGNNNDLVGRNLMFHSAEFIGIWPRGRKYNSDGARNTIALRDFYCVNGRKYGEFQSTGIVAGYGNVLHYLRGRFDQSWLRHIPLARQLLRIPALIGSRLYSEATVFACILEDFPYHNNRIVADDQSRSGVRVEYHIRSELKDRVREFRQLLKSKLKKHRMYPMNTGVDLNYGHPCGTCVAGNSAESSVIDKNCKLHAVSNLYITDASFMPSSGGANPSLTIAANALRVADKMSASLGKID